MVLSKLYIYQLRTVSMSSVERVRKALGWICFRIKTHVSKQTTKILTLCEVNIIILELLYSCTKMYLADPDFELRF